MATRSAYPATFDPEDGGYVVSFRDVPGANTEGDDEAEALAEAEDALVVALGHHVERRLPLPEPSRPRPGERLVAVPSLIAAKLALYEAMLEAGLSRSGLARKLGIAETAAARLLALHHRSHIGEVERALATLGKRLEVSVRNVA